ncbi:tryptophan synthase subunit alpha [Streptomyces lydicus]
MLNASPTADELASVLRSRRHPALGVFLPAGLTRPCTERATLDALFRQGADVIEVGIPVADPVLDGPVITAAYRRALDRGTTLPDALSTVEYAASKGPVVVMAYWETVVQHGPVRLARELKAAGASGVMIADLPPSQAGSWNRAVADAALSAPRLVPRDTPQEQLLSLCTAASGWLYAPASHARTGYQGPLSIAALDDFIQRLRSASSLPVVSGIGISTPQVAERIAPLVNGVVIGTPVVRALVGENRHEAEVLVADFAAALRPATEGTVDG